jgi:hypothetical protein
VTTSKSQIAKDTSTSADHEWKALPNGGRSRMMTPERQREIFGDGESFVTFGPGNQPNPSSQDADSAETPDSRSQAKGCQALPSPPGASRTPA